jgi:hypothetical protein
MTNGVWGRDVNYGTVTSCKEDLSYEYPLSLPVRALICKPQQVDEPTTHELE